MLPTKFRFIWPNGFRREESKKSANQKQESPQVAMFVNGSGRNEQSLQRTFHRCFLPSFISFGQAVSEEKLFQKSTNKKQELPMMAMFVNGSKGNEQFPQRTFHRCLLPSFGPFGQAVSEQKIFRNRPIRNKNCLWWPCLLMDWDKMSNLYREPFHRCFLLSFSSFSKAVSEEKIFQKSTNQKQELSVAAMFVNELGRNEQS